MHVMTRAEWQEFAQTGTRTGKVAVTRADGRPHVTPVWFLIDSGRDDDTVVFTTHAASLKGRALERDPRFSLCVDDQAPPYSFVVIDAEAELSTDPDELLHWAIRLGGRYMGAEQAEAFGRRNAVPGEYLVRGRITRVTAQAAIAE